MKHVVLYRKYRPKAFNDVIDQDDIAKTLLNQIQENKVSHAYLLVGPRGTGKTSISRILAKAVNCLFPDNGEPCNTCDSCKAINESTTLDYIELDAATNNGVDDIRRLTDTTQYAPSLLKRKVYVVDECHMLSKSAFNALLRTLEEPKGETIFILATTELNRVPATIISRCTKMYFKRINSAAMVENLKKVCISEKRETDVNGLKLIAANSDGAMRDALSMLDQVFSMTEGTVTETVVAEMLGYSNNIIIFSLIEALFQRNYNNILNIFHTLINQGKDVLSILSDLTLRLRDCMVTKASNGAVEIDCTEDYKNKLLETIETQTVSEILAIMTQVSKITELSKNSLNPLTIVETGITFLCLPVLDSSADMIQIVARLNELEKSVQRLLSSDKVITNDKVITKEIIFEKLVLADSHAGLAREFPDSGSDLKSENPQKNDSVLEEAVGGNTERPNDLTAIYEEENMEMKKQDERLPWNEPVVLPETKPDSLDDERLINLNRLRENDVVLDTILLNSEYEIKGNVIKIETIPPIQFVIANLYGDVIGDFVLEIKAGIRAEGRKL